MLTKKTEHHEHSYTKLNYKRESAPYGVRIILFRECKCGSEQAFECGPADQMRALFKKCQLAMKG